MLVPLLRQLVLLSNHLFQFFLNLRKFSNIRHSVKITNTGTIVLRIYVLILTFQLNFSFEIKISVLCICHFLN